MLLRAGKIVRFKGPHANEDAAEFAAEMHGRATREGNTVIVERETRFGIVQGKHAVVPVPLFALGDHFGHNGRSDAKPAGRTLGARS